MRMLFLVGRDIKHPGAGGGDIQAWEWARYAASRGHSTIYICLRHPGLPIAEELEGVRVLRLGRGALLPFKAWLFYKQHKDQLDVVYEDPIGGSRLPYLAPLYVRKPLVVAWHQVNWDLLRNGNVPGLVAHLAILAEKVLARLYRKSRVRAPSEETRVDLHRELGLPLERIHVVPASIPDTWLNSHREAPALEPNILWLGKFRRYKCPHHVVLAMKHVVKEIPQARLLLVGRRDDEKYQTRTAQLVVELGLSKNVDLRFNVSEDEKEDLLRSSRVLALPSVVEGFGMVVLEANASGVPVVASSGVPESAVGHDYNGLRYSFGDIPALAGSIIRLLKDETLRARLSANGLEFARQFAWRRVGAQFEDLVNLALAERGGIP